MAKIKNVSAYLFTLKCEDDRGKQYSKECPPNVVVDIPDKTYIESYDVNRLIRNGTIIVIENPAGFSEISYQNITSNGDIEFSSDTEVDYEIEIQKANDLVIGRIYIDSSSAAFYDIAEVIFFNHPDRKDNQIFYIANVAFVYTELSAPAGAGNTDIDVDDASDFIDDQLLSIKGSSQEFRRIDNISSNTVTLMDQLENSFNTDDGVSSVAEIGNFSLIDLSNNDKIYGRIKFDTAKTMTMKYYVNLVV